MNLPSTLYTLAAIGFFALMVNRPAFEPPAATVEATDETATTANQPPKDSYTDPSMQPTNPTN